MYEPIPSEFVRNYCKENGITFSDRERAALIIKFGFLPVKKLLSELESISAETDDSELKTDIENFARERRAAAESVMKKEEGYVYTTVCGGWQGAIFYDFETAKSYAEEHGGKKRYGIQKMKITEQNKQPTHHDLFGAMEYNSSGELIDVWVDDRFICLDKLADCFIPYVNPFERGDIVMNCVKKEIGIVQTSQKEWRDYIESPEKALNLGIINGELSIAFFHSGVGFHETGLCPLFLEKIENFDIDDPETKLLLEASAVLRGESAFDTVSGSGTLCSLFSQYGSLMRSKRR